jgi:hypothetical protein
MGIPYNVDHNKSGTIKDMKGYEGGCTWDRYDPCTEYDFFIAKEKMSTVHPAKICFSANSSKTSSFPSCFE